MEDLKELNNISLKQINGGFHPWFVKYQVYMAKHMYEALNGAYREGYDLAIQSCK